MTLAEFVNRAVGVPFKERGRGYDGWDCYGVVFQAHLDVLGIELPAYDGEYRSTCQRGRLEALIARETAARWSVPANPEAMDAILLRVEGNDMHLGLVIDSHRFLHVDRGVDTCVQEFTGLEWKGRVAGFYRFVKPQAAMAS